LNSCQDQNTTTTKRYTRGGKKEERTNNQEVNGPLLQREKARNQGKKRPLSRRRETNSEEWGEKREKLSRKSLQMTKKLREGGGKRKTIRERKLFPNWTKRKGAIKEGTEGTKNAEKSQGKKKKVKGILPRVEIARKRGRTQEKERRGS